MKAYGKNVVELKSSFYGIIRKCGKYKNSIRNANTKKELKKSFKSAFRIQSKNQIMKEIQEYNIPDIQYIPDDYSDEKDYNFGCEYENFSQISNYVDLLGNEWGDIYDYIDAPYVRFNDSKYFENEKVLLFISPECEISQYEISQYEISQYESQGFVDESLDSDSFWDSYFELFYLENNIDYSEYINPRKFRNKTSKKK